MGITGVMTRWSVPCAILVLATAACQPDRIQADWCLVLVAQVLPERPALQVGDTLTLHAAFGGRGPCTPADTTAAGVRWWSSDTDAIRIDRFSGRLTGRRPGWAQIFLSTRDSGAGNRLLGTTEASVLEPPSADTLTSLVSNLAADSATVSLYDANGTLLRSVTLPMQGVACWITPLSDSVQYSAQVYLPGHSGATSLGAQWVGQTVLPLTHTWRVTIQPQSSGPPTLNVAGISPDRGC